MINPSVIIQLIWFGIIALPVLLIMIVIRIIRRMERRAEERLQIEKENTTFQQQQMNAIKELNIRLSNIENMLKDVD